MKKLLHIIATPRGVDSSTLEVARGFTTRLQEKHRELVIDELNLFTQPLFEITPQQINGKYALLSGNSLSCDLRAAWQEVEAEINRFLSVDAYLISCPMWNFSIPYRLKQYIDIILQPGYLFRYTANGPEGLVKGKKMLIITSRGGDYSQNGLQQLDLQEKYMRSVFQFIGISDMHFINAQPMDAMGAEIRAQKISEARDRACMEAESFFV